MFSWNMDTVMLCSKNKEKLFSELELSDEQRVAQTTAIAEKYGFPKDISLSLLADKLPEAYGNRLREEKLELLSLANRVKHANTINANMASKTGGFLAVLMQNIANELKPAGTYSRNGAVKKNGYARVFNKSF